MATRRGGFAPSLDPFGTSRGGLGRYNVTGDSIQSLAETEAYAVAVAWGNGRATDDEYLASLTKLRDLAMPGSREYITAQNRLDDAVYTIGRNKLVRGVNNATTPASRIAALEAMRAYDTARLGSMDKADSQAYREQEDRVSGASVDIRQARYSEMVEKVNRGQGTTAQLLALAKSLRLEAGAGPDADEWKSTVADLTERVADEKLSDGFQAYQHHRKSGTSLLADIDRRLQGLSPGSPAYKQLQNQREDLAQRIKDENNSIHDATIAGQRSSGKITDANFLADLKKQYQDATPGTAEAINAGNRLRDFTFSLAEDKLRFDVTKGKRPVGDLIRFYTTYQRSMSPGSERWRQLQGAIDSLKHRGGSGGGGGGRRGSGSGIALGPKLIGGNVTISDLIGDPKVKTPPGFADLLRVDITSSTSKKWWDNNMRSMIASFQDGRGSWTYYDKRGNGYQMPFTPDLMTQMDQLNVAYMHRALAGATNAKDAQHWVGLIISAQNAQQSRGATYDMSVYTRTYAAIERAKQQALAGGRFGEYSNLVREQRELARRVLGIQDGQPTDLSNASNPYLTDNQRAGIMKDLASLAPKNDDQESDYYNPEGDKVLQLIQQGAITTQADPSSGDILTAQLDPYRGYVTQLEDGSIGLVTVDSATNPEAFRPDPNTGELVPRYRDEAQQVTIRLNGEDVQVWQPVKVDTDTTSGAIVYVIDKGQTAGLAQSLQMNDPGGTRPASYRPVINPVNKALAQLPLLTMFTVEHGKKVKWISTDGETWIRVNDGSNVSVRLVVDPSVTIGADGKWQRDGAPLSEADVRASIHIWGGMDAVAAGARDDGQWGVGAPGASFQMRKKAADGSIDGRSDRIIQSEEDQLIHAQALRHGGALNPNQPIETAPLPATGGQGPAYDVSRLIYNNGELLPPQFRAKPSAVPAIGGFGGARLGPMAMPRPLLGPGANADLGLKPKPYPTLKPPPVAQLAPIAPIKLQGAPGAYRLPPPPPPPKKQPPKKPTPPKVNPGGAPGAYRPPPSRAGGGPRPE